MPRFGHNIFVISILWKSKKRKHFHRKETQPKSCLIFAATFGEMNLGMDYFEGDILLTERQRDAIESSRKGSDIHHRALIKDRRKLWKKGLVPFVIADDLSK